MFLFILFLLKTQRKEFDKKPIIYRKNKPSMKEKYTTKLISNKELLINKDEKSKIRQQKYKNSK